MSTEPPRPALDHDQQVAMHREAILRREVTNLLTTVIHLEAENRVLRDQLAARAPAVPAEGTS
jgi:predicted  nucleic acid-binding Zn-ribbon protein